MIRSRQQDELSPLEITCFFEELPLPGVGQVSSLVFTRVVLTKSSQVVPRESAALPGYIPISIRQNHMNMTKFADEEDPGFQAVLGELRRWTDALNRFSLLPKQPGSPQCTSHAPDPISIGTETGESSDGV